MKPHYRMYRRRHFPFGFFMIAFLFMAFFGWKLFFFIPLFMMMTCWGTQGRNWQSEMPEKAKRKVKNDDWDGDYL